MREIKFRAWDSETKKFYPWGILGEGFRTPPQRAGWKFDHSQYTGLKDKNGVEIYEGDILSSPSMPNSPVEFQRGSFNAVYADGSHDEWEAPLWRYSVEVIGNIYETPELLKEKQ